METIKAFLEITKSQFHSSVSLILCMVLLIGGFVFVDDFLEKFLDDELYRGTIYILIFLFWIAFWVHYRFKLPKNKKGEIGIVIAIYAENEVERQKLKLDFQKFEEQSDESMVELTKKSNNYLEQIIKDMQIVTPSKMTNSTLTDWK